MTAKGTRTRYCKRGHDKDLPNGRTKGRSCAVCHRAASRRLDAIPRTSKCTKGHDVSVVGTWGGVRRRCKACIKDRLAKSTSHRSMILKKCYGLTIEEESRLVCEQGGLCAGCGLPPSGKGKSNSRLGVDHDHETGLVRGMLCSKCNMAIGLAGDSPERLRMLAQYLVRHINKTVPWENEYAG